MGSVREAGSLLYEILKQRLSLSAVRLSHRFVWITDTIHFASHGLTLSALVTC